MLQRQVFLIYLGRNNQENMLLKDRWVRAWNPPWLSAWPDWSHGGRLRWKFKFLELQRWLRGQEEKARQNTSGSGALRGQRQSWEWKKHRWWQHFIQTTLAFYPLGMKSYVPEIYKGHPVFTVRLLQTRAITSHSLTREGKAMTISTCCFSQDKTISLGAQMSIIPHRMDPGAHTGHTVSRCETHSVPLKRTRQGERGSCSSGLRKRFWLCRGSRSPGSREE